ncbi:MAG: 6-bladed beta-propeller, partial [Bacteroidetes bacterium]|nr:6-bladed beta-propeller [Bacteroidota bacterium]
MMFNVFNKGLIILIGAILFSCSPQETTVPVIDLTTSHDSGQLCLNEILTDYKLVRLETSPEILIPQSYRKYIGEKYILILTDDKIFQFDTEGKLIRILASHGKGPGEYSRINHFNVNSDE